MTTGKDYGLPTEYADWVEWTPDRARHTGPVLRLSAEVSDHTDHWGKPVSWRITLVPPKPKPTLPDVGPGGVIRFRSKIVGVTRRAIRTNDYRWRVFEKGTPVVYHGNDFVDPKATDEELLGVVDDDGFTVELEGLA